MDASLISLRCLSAQFLTLRVSGLLARLENKGGISIMADRGFTIKDMLREIGVELNIPPFMEGRQQLPAE